MENEDTAKPREQLRADFTLTMVVEDDGIGLPDGVYGSTTRSLGWDLVNTLVERSGGSMDVRTAPGTTAIITLPTRSTRDTES